MQVLKWREELDQTIERGTFLEGIKHAYGGTLHKPSITLNEGKADTGTGPKFVGSISEQHDKLSGGIWGSNMADIEVSEDAQEQSIHVCLENDVSGNNIVASDEILQRHGPLCAICDYINFMNLICLLDLSL